MENQQVKHQVQEFYNRVGWQEVSDGIYQNARYEDLRPVSREYIHRCHLRILRHLKPEGRLLLDGGSGPIQYPEYLEYSKGYKYRVCADISIVAVQEARKRIGEHGLFVVCDISYLPFKTEVFDGAVSLHTIHHLPLGEQLMAYKELNRVIYPNTSAVIVNGWPSSKFMDRWEWFVGLMEHLMGLARRIKRGKEIVASKTGDASKVSPEASPKSTFTKRLNADDIHRELAGLKYEIFVWRSVSVRFLRAVIHPFLGGKHLLRFLFWHEDRRPDYYGMFGQYPMIVLRKPGESDEQGSIPLVGVKE